jgi:hypothetical protein
MTDANHVGDRNDMVIGDNDHGDAVPKCGSCGVAWVDHIGIMGVCAENAKLREERDEARREACERTAENLSLLGSNARLETLRNEHAARRGWDCYETKEKAQ